MLAEVGRRVERPERRYELRRQADAILEAASGSLPATTDREALDERHRRVIRMLGE